MRIVLLSPPWLPLPPKGYGGIETVVYNLSEELTQRGHEVFTFATGDSVISSELRYFYKKSLGIDTLLEKNYLFFLLNHVYDALRHLPPNIDIIHNHCEYGAMYFFDSIKIPFLHTLHGAFYQQSDTDNHASDHAYRAHQEVLSLFAQHPFVSISNAQRKGKPDIRYIETVYNGIDTRDFSFFDKGNDSLSWLGRYSPLKGISDAIKVAERLNRRLHISAFIHAERQKQFDTEVKHHADADHFSLEEVNTSQEKSEFLGNSRAFLFPIQWEEPFGLVLIESMACGTPVVAYGNGSVPEIVKDGETGFIVNYSPEDIRGDWIIKKTGIEGLCEAVERIYRMPEESYRKMRKACREHVEANFTVQTMAIRYEEVYKHLV